MIVKEILDIMEKIAPNKLIDKWDNCGFQIGDINKNVKTIMLTLDVTEEVVQEAINKNVDLIISHHPILFNPISKITLNDTKGKMLYDIIKHDISVYSAHTNLDVCKGGVNDILADILQLRNTNILSKLYEEKLYKLVVFVPKTHVEKVRDAITESGGGWIGNYSHCTFNINGFGTFMPREGTNPFIGTEGKVEVVEEIRIETIVPESILDTVVENMIKAHPYEEVAYDIYLLNNKGFEYGYGRIGDLQDVTTLGSFAKYVKEKLNCKFIKVIGDVNKEVRKVAVCGGSGAEFIKIASKKGADVLVTGDIKYHEAQLAISLGLALIDANHYDTEKVILPYLKEYIQNEVGNSIDIYISNFNSVPYEIF
ncbi:Nif3-like dinuclear metal center hexameric protein [Caloranaerobacter sp. DY30410]|uniref:Nif3-like dinuclear metal center hexameric protein n=1 Tax=Caloranaerobacter sp. DY30410 TaxID=3238305 RepID=UPI003CFBDA92